VKIFGREDQEVTGNWRQLHSATLHDLYCYLNVIRVVNRGGRDGLGMWHVWGEGKCKRDFGLGSLKGHHLHEMGPEYWMDVAETGRQDGGRIDLAESRDVRRQRNVCLHKMGGFD